MRAKAQARVRAAAWSARSSEKRAAAAPAGTPGEGDRRHHFPVALLGARDQPRDHLPLLDARDVRAGERQPPVRMARGDDAGALAVEGEDVELAHVAPDAEDLPDLLVQERGALELPPIADGGRDLAGEGDGPLAQVLLDPAARQAERQRGEAEGDDDEHGDAQEDELEPDAEAHRLRPLSRGGRSPGTAARRASIRPRRSSRGISTDSSSWWVGSPSKSRSVSSWQDTRRAAAACTVVMGSPPRHQIQVRRAYRRAPEGSTTSVRRDSLCPGVAR